MNLYGSRYDKPFSAEFGNLLLIASLFNKGFLIGRYRKLSRFKSYENVLLSGPTGSGKTSRFLLKQLYSLKNCSLLINDPQSELYQYGSGALQKHFKHIYSINFSDSTQSAGYNPFARIKRSSDVHKLASLLISNTLDKGSGDVFWSLSSINLTQILIRILLHQPKEYHNLHNLIRLLQYFTIATEKVDKWAARTNDEALIAEYKALIATPEKTLQNVIASVKAALQVFDDPEIAKTTAYDSINFEQMRKEPTAIFLNNTLGNQKYLSVLNAVLFEQFYSFVLEKLPSKDDISIFVVLEECASMFIPLLPQAMATTRKAKCGNFIVVQSHSQLKALYKDQADVIKANAMTKIWLGGQTSMDELRDIETLGGKRIYKDKKGVERTVPLITADAIRMLPENRSLILSSIHPLILAKSSPYFKSLFFRRFAKIPPVPLHQYIPDESIPTLR